MKWCFSWSITGSTVIEAPTFAEANTKYEAMGTSELLEDGSYDVATDQQGFLDSNNHFVETDDRGESLHYNDEDEQGRKLDDDNYGDPQETEEES